MVEVPLEKLIIEGLTGEEQLALQDEIDSPALELKAPPLQGGQVGEPVTIAVIVLGKLAILGLSAFLLKKRRESKGKAERIRAGKITLETGQGRLEIQNLEIDFPASNHSSEDLAQAISKELNGALDQYLKQS